MQPFNIYFLWQRQFKDLTNITISPAIKIQLKYFLIAVLTKIFAQKNLLWISFKANRHQNCNIVSIPNYELLIPWW
jgi:hypothetical protein